MDDKTFLERAQEIVFGDRQEKYGHPTPNHTCTGEMFTLYLERRYGEDDDDNSLDAQDVCIFNILQKISRLAHTPGHLDSLIDICGYVACIERDLEYTDA